MIQIHRDSLVIDSHNDLIVAISDVGIRVSQTIPNQIESATSELSVFCVAH